MTSAAHTGEGSEGRLRASLLLGVPAFPNWDMWPCTVLCEKIYGMHTEAYKETVFIELWKTVMTCSVK